MYTTVTAEDGWYVIVPPFPMPELKLIGARLRRGKWLLPRKRCYLKRLMDTVGNLRVAPEIKQEFDSQYGFIETGLLDDYFDYKSTPDYWNAAHPYQQDAIRYMVNSPHSGALLNIDPGLGKTFTSIVAAKLYCAATNNKNPILVISPLSFLPGWRDEIQRWIGESAFIAHQQNYPEHANWVLTNYDTVVGNQEWFKREWSVIILDESIAAKNRKSQRAKTFERLNAKKTWLLSGSPLTKFADDLFAQFRIIDKQAFASYWRFANTYCIVEETTWGSKVVGNRTNINIRDEFKDIMYTLKEHELELNKVEMMRMEVATPMAADQQEMFRTMLKEFVIELESGDRIETSTIAARLTYLQQIVSHPGNLDPNWTGSSSKLDTLIANLDNWQPPMIIWTWWVRTSQIVYNALRQRGKRVGLYTGSNRIPADAIAQFQAGELDYLVLSLGVGKYGHTFNMARTAVYYDRTFDIDAFLQSQARITGGLRGLSVKFTPRTITLKTPFTTDAHLENNLLRKAHSLSHVAQHDLHGLLSKLLSQLEE